MDLYKNMSYCLSKETNRRYANFYIDYIMTDIQKKNQDNLSLVVQHITAREENDIEEQPI